MRGIVAILSIISVITACNFAEISESFVWKKNQTFDTGFRTGNAQLEQIGGEEYICFMDYRTNKEVVLHHTNSTKKYRVDLSSIYELNEKVTGVEIINLDTILAITERTNKLFMIDSKGKIWRTINLNPYVEKEGYYELYRSATPFQFNDTTLIFAMEYGMKNLPLKAQRDFEQFNREKYNSFNLFKIDNIFSDSLNVSFGLKGIYNNFTDAQYIAMEGSDFTFFEDQIIFKSCYSDTLYLIDPTTLTTEKKVRIQSEFSGLHITPITIEEEKTIPNIVNENFKTGGNINRISYDKDKDIYYVMVAHTPILNNDHDRPWSMIILDSEFNKIDEIKMNHTKYYHHGFVSNNGLLISNYYETFDDRDHFSKNTYGLFNYE